MGKRQCFYVDETMWTPKGYIPALVTEDEPGYSPAIGRDESQEPWYWGTDISTAKHAVWQANLRRGISPKDADDIVTSSIRASIANDARRDARDARLARLQGGRS